MRPIDELLDVMRRLRDPDTGCPWDIEQDFASIAPYTIEEAYEVADAIARNDLDDLKGELGDLLLQVVFHAQMAEEAGAFDFEAVSSGIVDKLVRRHPHVFGEACADDAEAVLQRWEAVKAEERAERRTGDAPQSALDDVAIALPALMRAEKLQRRAARVGFDWPEIAPVRTKLFEEIAEVDVAANAQDADALEDELGDVLFSAVNLARHHHVDAERALVRANAKFEQRFRAVESLATERGTPIESLGIDALEVLWKEVKRC